MMPMPVASTSPCSRQTSAQAQKWGGSAGVAFDRNAELGSVASGLADPMRGRVVTPDDPVRIAFDHRIFVGEEAVMGVNQIAQALCLSGNTVSTYRARVFEKLELKNLVERTVLVSRGDLLDVTPERAQMDWWVLEDKTRRDTAVSCDASWVTTSGSGTVAPVDGPVT